MLAREQLLKIDALEGFARLAIGSIESYLGQRALRAASGEGALDVLELDFLFERRQREVLDHAFQLGEVSRPTVMAQRVERRDGKAPLRTQPRLDKLREHERGEVGDVFGELAQRRQPESQLAEPHGELRIELMLIGQGS